MWILEADILETDINDHYPVFHIVDMSFYPRKTFTKNDDLLPMRTLANL